MNDIDRFRGCLLGLAVGDAVGTTLEFKTRGSFTPITDMLGGGPFHLQPGQWTDDTSMALCLATSLVECGGFDAHDQMTRYLKWYTEGYLSSTGVCFDIGNTVRQALMAFYKSDEPFSGSTDKWSAGNGSLMRLAPIPMFYYPDREQVLQFAVESSRTTHGAQECVDACLLFANMLLHALGGAEKETILLDSRDLDIPSGTIQRIAFGDYMNKTSDQITSSGYVVKSLEAALWCFWTTNSFGEAILTAANLGDDADTTAAICGQVAGAYYGETGIPSRWLEKLFMVDEIKRLAVQLQAGAA